MIPLPSILFFLSRFRNEHYTGFVEFKQRCKFFVSFSQYKWDLGLKKRAPRASKLTCRQRSLAEEIIVSPFNASFLYIFEFSLACTWTSNSLAYASVVATRSRWINTRKSEIYIYIYKERERERKKAIESWVGRCRWHFPLIAFVNAVMHWSKMQPAGPSRLLNIFSSGSSVTNNGSLTNW